jgi:hypothetical protein
MGWDTFLEIFSQILLVTLLRSVFKNFWLHFFLAIYNFFRHRVHRINIQFRACSDLHRLCFM